MRYPTPAHKIIARDKGLFRGNNLVVSTDAVSWHQTGVLEITADGKLVAYNDTSEPHVYLKSMQGCFIQILTNLSTITASGAGGAYNARRRLTRKSSSLSNNSGPESNSNEEPPIVFLKTYDNEKLYIRLSTKNVFSALLSNLLVWQGLRPQGLAKKWYCENKVLQSTDNSPDIHELLVCRCKVYGPLPSKSKNIHIASGPRAPPYQPQNHPYDDDTSLNHILQTDTINEGWFYSLGVLKSNGILNFVSELDGTLLYSVDVKSMMSSEIREVHHSLFDSSNILFIGFIEELRKNNRIKTISALSGEHSGPFLMRDGRAVLSCQRLFIEFPLHIDLEDWLVGLNYFSKREYIGTYPILEQDASDAKDDVNLDADPPALSSFEKVSLRVSKKVLIDIIEAQFEDGNTSDHKIYAEVVMWGLPWSRTALVDHTKNPFWKEAFAADLPILTQMIHILIKKTYNNQHGNSDKLLGTVYLTPDVLTKHLHTSTTMTMNYQAHESFGNMQILDNGSLNDIVRLPVYDSSNLPIGRLLLNVTLREHHILPPTFYKPFENMLSKLPLKELIKFCNESIDASEMENVSMIILDIMQSLNIEDQWFRALMEVELVNVDKMTRKVYVANKRSNGSKQGDTNKSSNNVFNTLFRGSSIFSKSLEKYNFRIGQEYLEKLLGKFINKVYSENKNCEIDPRYVKLELLAELKNKSADDSDLESESDFDLSVEEEKKRDKIIQERTQENFNNLYGYMEDLWHKIYTTSNDLPAQIKEQLKHFRTKVELACDPDDKVTALNCLSAFIFLRFFCPAILNPKLFYLSKNHHSGRVQRTLTLIAKILLNFANRQEFSVHKERYLVQMNLFLERHQDEIYDYFDKITGRKNDFNEKILDLSHDVKRFDMGLSSNSAEELPTTPYLIDKYLRLTELVKILDHNKAKFKRIGRNGEVIESISSLNTVNSSPGRESSAETEGDGEKAIYKIGSLEFEKSDLLDLAVENEAEGFIKSLTSDENIFSFINSRVTLRDLQGPSTKLMRKINKFELLLENYEYPAIYQASQDMWDAFTTELISKIYLDTSRQCLIHSDGLSVLSSDFKKFTENSLSTLKLKFSSNPPLEGISIENSMSRSSSTTSLGSIMKTSTKNPFKRWLRKA